MTDMVNDSASEKEMEMESVKQNGESGVSGEKDAAKNESDAVGHEQKSRTGRFNKNAKIRELEDKIKELNDKYLRLFSEFDNFRKRTLKEKVEMSKYASADTITGLLPILDDFERAIRAMESSKENEQLQEGVRLIYTKLFGMLERRGLKAIEARGKDFDTDFHEAITQIPVDSAEQKGKVVDEIEKGYLLNNKVIRFSKVVIGQ
ncbi:MAG: nucleotide exchange factor GrpE [Bacteroidales bacterium]|nr:nucleotide exchange factor GrpE [Bacteroidales bacterium]